MRKTKPILLTRHLMIGAALAVLSLSACKKADTGPKTPEQAKQEAAKLDRPKPGQYQQTMTITRFELPGAPPEVAKQFGQGMSQAQEHSFCLTPEMANQGYRDMFDKVGNKGECKYDRFDVSGGELNAVIHCENAHDGKGTITMSGKVSEEGSDVNVTLDQTGGQGPMNNTKIAMHVVSHRTGDCAATK